MYYLPEFAAACADPAPVVAALAPVFGKPGLSTRRAVDAVEVRELLGALPRATRRVRVYSAWGFVPNSYRSRCSIQYVEAELVAGVWRIATGRTGAQRSNGSGSLAVVQ